MAAERLEKYEDGLYYFYLPSATQKMYQETKDFCTQVAGFDLPIFITQKQFEVAKIINDKIPGELIYVYRDLKLHSRYCEQGYDFIILLMHKALFDSLGRVANVSLEGDLCKQARFPVNFGGLTCRRAGDIALSPFLSSINSVSELVETFLSRINIEDTNELPEGVESWWGLVEVLLCQMTRVVRRPGTFLLLREIGEMSWERQTNCLEPDCWPRRRRSGLGSMLCRFRRFGHYWTPRALVLPLPLEWTLMFVFLILAAETGGWTVKVCMACPANAVLAAFHGIRQ